MSAVASLAPARRAILERRVRIVVAITITWNVVEAIVAIAAGAERGDSDGDGDGGPAPHTASIPGRPAVPGV